MKKKCLIIPLILLIGICIILQNPLILTNFSQKEYFEKDYLKVSAEINDVSLSPSTINDSELPKDINVTWNSVDVLNVIINIDGGNEKTYSAAQGYHLYNIPSTVKAGIHVIKVVQQGDSNVYDTATLTIICVNTDVNLFMLIIILSGTFLAAMIVIHRKIRPINTSRRSN